MKHKQGDPIQVEWVDTMQSSGWHDLKPTDIRCKTIGMYHSEDKEKLAIAQSKSAYGYGDYIEIPKVSIKRVRKLKV